MCIFAVKLYSQKTVFSKPYHNFSDSTQKKITAYFNKQYKSGIFNGTFLMFSNDSMMQGALGYANFKNWDTLINDDLFQLASVSKTFTGTAILLMQQDGLLQIDDSVHWYIPQLNRKNLTIRHLLSHTSGLPDYFYFGSGYWPYTKHMKNSDVVNQLNQQPYTSFASPGRFHSYSNTNYVLLAHIVERLTGMDFRKYVQVNLFAPAGMKKTHIYNADSFALNGYIVAGCENKLYISDNAYNGATGDKGVYSSTSEMFLFDRAMRTSYILHKKTKELLYTPVVPAGEGIWYACGWRIKWVDGKRWAFHNGFWKGFRTYYFRCLDEDKFFCVLTNNVYGPFLKSSEIMNLISE